MLEELVAKQEESAVEIEKAIANIRKAPLDRRTLDFYEKKSAELIKLWKVFEQQDNSIRRHPSTTTEHPYLTKNVYDTVKTKFCAITDEINNAISACKEKPALVTPQKPLPAVREPKQQREPSEFRSTIRRQRALIISLERLLQGQSKIEAPMQSMYAIDKLWANIEEMHLTVHEFSDDPSADGYDIARYLELEGQVLKHKEELLNIQKGTQPRVNTLKSPSIELPKMTIPKFDGDYLKWQTFADIFTKMIHEQPLPAIQKMWYLKANITGDADRLIRHFELTEANYLAAWDTLTERFNNKRALASALMQKIMNLPNLTSEGKAIRDFHDVLNESLAALRNLGIEISKWDPLLIHILIKKLDRQSHIMYEQSLDDPKELQTMEHFLHCLQNRFQSLDAVGGKDKVKAVSTIAASNNTDCPLCKTNHPLYYCGQFLKMAPAERLKWVQKNNRCINCFRADHIAKACTKRSCTKCPSKHNSLLHLEHKSKCSNQQQSGTQQPAQNSSVASSSTVAAAQSSTTASANQHNGRQGSVLLATARIKITATNGRTGEFRAILDSGSQINIVTERLVKRLSIEPKKTYLSIKGIGGRSRNSSQRANISVQSMTGRFSARLEAFVLPSIIPAQPSRSFDISSWPIPENIQLADPYFNNTGKIDVLLGAEFYFDLMLSEEIRLSKDLPILRNTRLGWIASGIVEESSSSSAICAVHSEDELATSEIIQQFWKVDDFHEDANLTLAEQKCENHFLQNTIRNSDGRFVVRLPFAEDPISLAESKEVALSRFLALERRLTKNPQLQKQYVDFMKEYEALGHMTRISTQQVQGTHFYIPHHCVLRPDSSTTKLRVVFDASAKTASGYSLNDVLCTGPTVQGDLFGMLLRFRLPRFVFTTDIEKMYRQILVDERDRKFQQILWRNAPGETIGHYALNTVTYGTSSAPYLATKCLQQLAEANTQKYPLGAPVLRHDFYVDDGMSGADSLATAIEIQQQLSNLLHEAGFKLRKWCANHSRLLQGIPPEDREVNLDFDHTSTKVLGLTWIPKSDQFCLKADVTDCSVITKRSVTSDVARIFDPLGIAGPVVAAAKIFIQKLWQMQISWDEQLPTEMCAQWSSFRQGLTQLNNNHLGRHIFDTQKAVQVQIHVFVDASEKAYGSALYLRSKLEDGRLIVRLLCAKSRVAPLKGLTLPRLELCAAALGAELTARVKRELRFENIPTFYWSDSEIVLYWINSTSSSLRTFVANKVKKIQTLTECNQWRHVSTRDNPADLISRGISPDRLSTCGIWFYGPTFLHGKETVWPQPFVKEALNSTSLEFKQRAAVTAAASSDGLQDIIYTINHRNSFRRLQRIVAYVMRFVEAIKQSSGPRSKNISLTPRELDNALSLIVRTVQGSEFEIEIKQLARHKALDKSSPIYSLSPFLDDKGVLRIGGRLEESTLSFDAKHPMLLPYNDPITKVILVMMHNDNHHCGPQLLLANSRQRFWIIKGKSMARNVVQNCVRCTRARPRLFQQIMGNLPASRVTPARPFIKTGVDYCGPVWVHYKLRGKRPHKVYIAVFCCFATKAVHLEVVTDLTTDAFLGALKRFIARRGRCQTIYSDNATNFVGAKNQLEELQQAIFKSESQKKIMDTCNNKGIEFKFIPPRAPHFGGLWEAAVKSAKHLLLRTVEGASLTHEELETVVVEIEAVLNSRPLTPISTNASDLMALTPGHFLVGEPLIAQVDTRASQQTTSLATRWKLVSQIKHEFWRRWSNEYLTQLQERHKWKSTSPNIQKGQMVIIKEDNVPVMKWPLGRITETYPGSDGIVRVVEVKTSSGVIKRPIHRLAPLIEDKSEDSSFAANPLEEDLLNDPGPSPAKRSKPTGTSFLLTAVITLFLLPLVLSNSIKIQRFGSDPGIYFEGIGTAKMVTAEWKIIAFYEVGPFWAELDAFSAGLRTFQQLCETSSRKKMCDSLATNLNMIQGQLMEEKEVLLIPRKKRAAFNIVGNVAHALFGVLDSDYAEGMIKTIDKLKDDRNHIAELLRNQTSVIDSTINIIKQDEVTSNFRISEIQKTVVQFSNIIEGDRQEIDRTQALALLSTQLSLMATKLQQTESVIVEVLTDAHHGRISPQLVTPHQLLDEIHTIRAHLPTSRTLPISEDNIVEFYKLMRARGRVTRDKIIFEITLPLVDQQHFDFFKLIPVPSSRYGHLFTIATDTHFLAINSHRDEYIPISTDDMKTCFRAKDDNFICRNMQSKLSRESPSISCEINIFNNKSTTACKLSKTYDGPVWIQTNQLNQWLFAIANSTEVSAVCGTELTQLTITGSGILQLEPNCVLKDRTITIQGHYSTSSILHTSYARFRSIESLSTSTEVAKIMNNQTKQFKTHVEELKNLQNQLESLNIANLTTAMESNTIHHHAVSYSALVMSVGLAIIYFIRKTRSRQIYTTNNQQGQHDPQPAPRQPPAQAHTSDITIK